jgi:RNA-directed DNA polymerase
VNAGVLWRAGCAETCTSGSVSGPERRTVGNDGTALRSDFYVVHCVSERQARHVLAAIAERMEQVGLRLHPAKTRIVYCKDANRRLVYEHIEFTFLGFTFRPRGARGKDGRIFLSFQPAISKDALNKISRDVRRWRLHRWSNATLADLAITINPIVRGWMNYYGAFYRSAIYPLLARINAYLVRWFRRKHERLRGLRKAHRAFTGATQREPRLFAHWQWVPSVW